MLAQFQVHLAEAQGTRREPEVEAGAVHAPEVVIPVGTSVPERAWVGAEGAALSTIHESAHSVKDSSLSHTNRADAGVAVVGLDSGSAGPLGSPWTSAWDPWLAKLMSKNHRCLSTPSKGVLLPPSSSLAKKWTKIAHRRGIQIQTLTCEREMGAVAVAVAVGKVQLAEGEVVLGKCLVDCRMAPECGIAQTQVE